MLNIRRTINKLGITNTYLGYRYLVRSIELALNDENSLLAVNKMIYNVVAQEYNTSSAAVQRNLRTAINACWKNGNRPYLNEIAGYAMIIKPTITEFVSMVATYIKDEELSSLIREREHEQALTPRHNGGSRNTKS